MSEEVLLRKAECTGAGKPLRLKKSPMPELIHHMVRVKVAFAGICHSDVHLIEDQDRTLRRTLGGSFEGLVPGHEIAGTVDKIGQEVEKGRFSVGDRVLVCPWQGCFQCEACQAGLNNQCMDNPCGTRDVGQSLEKPGGFQSHIDVNPDFLLKVDATLGLDVACMIPCSASTVYSALKKLEGRIDLVAKRSRKPRLLIIGAGGLGLWAVTLSRAMYDHIYITVTDINEKKLILAKDAGADDVILTDQKLSPEENKIQITKAGLFDATIDLIGTSSTSECALHSLQHGGTLVFIGLYGGDLLCPLSLMIGRSLTVTGIRTSNMQCIAEVLDLVIKKQLSHPCLHYVCHDDVNAVLDDLANGKVQGRTLIKYD